MAIAMAIAPIMNSVSRSTDLPTGQEAIMVAATHINFFYYSWKLFVMEMEHASMNLMIYTREDVGLTSLTFVSTLLSFTLLQIIS